MSVESSDGDNPDCKCAARNQLESAGILDEHGSEHAFKEDMGYTPVGHFDNCACRDGTIRIAQVNGCSWNTPKGETGCRWR